MLYIFRLVWNFSCRKVEWIDLADLINISGEFLWTTDDNFARKDFAESGVFHCPSYPIHWLFPINGLVALGVDQSEQFKHEFVPKLGGATNEFWYSNVCSCSGMASSYFFDYQSSIKNLCGRSLGQRKYDWNLPVCTARNKSLLDGILKIVISNNSSSQSDLTSRLVKEKYLAYIWG